MSLDETHVSGITAWQECARKWYYSSVLGFKPPSYRNRDPQKIGTWGHYALALTLRGVPYQQAVEETIDRQLELWDKLGHSYTEDDDALFTQFENLMGAYALWEQADRSRYANYNLDFIDTEKPFKLEFQGYKLGGIWDGVVRLKATGELIPFERKLTTKPDHLENGVQWDLQPRFYAWALERIYQEPVVGVLYEFIRICDPFNVKVLQNGWPSTAKPELDGTTYGAYKTILTAAAWNKGLTLAEVPDKYQQALDYLKSDYNPIFRRVFLPLSNQAKNWGAARMVYAAEQMALDRQAGDLIMPSLNRYSCPFCAYREPCLAYDAGVDWEAMLGAMFIQNEERFDADLEGK